MTLDDELFKHILTNVTIGLKLNIENKYNVEYEVKMKTHKPTLRPQSHFC